MQHLEFHQLTLTLTPTAVALSPVFCTLTTATPPSVILMVGLANEIEADWAAAKPISINVNKEMITSMVSRVGLSEKKDKNGEVLKNEWRSFKNVYKNLLQVLLSITPGETDLSLGLVLLYGTHYPSN